MFPFFCSSFSFYIFLWKITKPYSIQAKMIFWVTVWRAFSSSSSLCCADSIGLERRKINSLNLCGTITHKRYTINFFLDSPFVGYILYIEFSFIFPFLFYLMENLLHGYFYFISISFPQSVLSWIYLICFVCWLLFFFFFVFLFCYFVQFLSIFFICFASLHSPHTKSSDCILLICFLCWCIRCALIVFSCSSEFITKLQIACWYCL